MRVDSNGGETKQTYRSLDKSTNEKKIHSFSYLHQKETVIIFYFILHHIYSLFHVTKEGALRLFLFARDARPDNFQSDFQFKKIN